MLRASNREDKKIAAAAVSSEAKKYEFGGPLGALLLIIGLPSLILLINLACDKVIYQWVTTICDHIFKGECSHAYW